MRLPRVMRSRRAVQWAATAVVLAIGAQFTLWVRAHLDGAEPPVPRPPGVEAFLPINAMLTLKHLLLTGVVDRVHPAGLAIFLGICLMSAGGGALLLLPPVPGRPPVGARRQGRGSRPGPQPVAPGWLDLPLRGLKWLLLAFFVWAVWWSMDAEAVADFIASPYARVADAKMWLFFAHPSRLTVAVLGVLVVGSFFVRDLWCRYLCPYGALVGLLGRVAPLQVERDPGALHRLPRLHQGLPGPPAGPHPDPGGVGGVHQLPGLRRRLPRPRLPRGPRAAPGPAAWATGPATAGGDRRRGGPLPGRRRRLPPRRPLATAASARRSTAGAWPRSTPRSTPTSGPWRRASRPRTRRLAGPSSRTLRRYGARLTRPAR